MTTASSATPGSRVAVLTAALLFSTGGAAIKATSLSSFQVAGFRSGVAALAILLLLPQARRGFTRRSLMVGVAYAGTMLQFVVATKLTTAANTIFLQSTAPLYVLLLSPILLRERARRSDLVYMALLALGLSAFFIGERQPDALAPNPLLGNIIATSSGVTWALTILGLRWLSQPDSRGRTPSNLTGVLAGNVITFAVCLPVSFPVSNAAPMDAALILYLGVFQIALAYLLLSRGLEKTPALEGSLLLLVEPVLNPIWAFWFHRETPGPWALAGGALILGATFARTAYGFATRPR